ncbi:MAG: hypothetical protein AAF716_04110 [Cyanobacteria bacterium P01_D01_bin.1]
MIASHRWSNLEAHAEQIVNTTAQAYSDLGMRDSLSLHAIDQLLHRTIPYLAELHLEELLSEESKQTFVDAVSEFLLKR